VQNLAIARAGFAAASATFLSRFEIPGPDGMQCIRSVCPCWWRANLCQGELEMKNC